MPKAKKPKKVNRLFVSNGSDGVVYFFANTIWEALVSEPTARVPTAQEMLEFVTRHNIGNRTMSDVGAQFGVSKQTVLNWKRKAGVPAQVKIAKRKAITDAVIALGEADIEGIKRIAEQFGVSASTVDRYCRVADVKRKKFVSRRRPSDKQLIVEAVNKTWTELARHLGLSLNYLRGYVYKRPELARALRVVMVRDAPKKVE